VLVKDAMVNLSETKSLSAGQEIKSPARDLVAVRPLLEDSAAWDTELMNHVKIQGQNTTNQNNIWPYSTPLQELQEED